MTLLPLTLDSGGTKQAATLDPSGRYRYSLERQWDASAPRLACILLNPSTADATRDDPTLRRCLGFARSWGYGALEVVNLFAYRATHPRQLRQVPDPIGPENDRYLLAARGRAQTLWVAWGNAGSLYNRDRAVLCLLSQPGECFCLGLTRCGQPRHPLYVRGDAGLTPFGGAPG